MRIDKLDVYYVSMPLIYPWRTAYGVDYDIHSVLVKATSGEHEGWSESTPFFAPTYLPESAGSVYYLVTEVFGPHIVGRDYETAADLNRRLDVFKGNSFAKAAIEICWWTLEVARTGTPLHRLLGGETREVVAGADFGIQDSLDMLLGNIQRAVDAGFPRIKLKVAKGWDLDVLRTVCATFPKMTFHIDCNAGYTLDDLPFFKAIDGLGTGVHRAAAALRRRARPCGAGAADWDAGLPRRDDHQRQGSGAGNSGGCVPIYQYQAGPHRRVVELAGRPRLGAGGRYSGVGWWHVGERCRRRVLCRVGYAAQLHLPR